MLVTIHQPDFLPWLGFFDRWRKSDLYIVLDDVQYLRRGWHNRDKIKTKDGIKLLTIPVIKKGKYHQVIREVKIDNSSNWRHKHLKTIKSNYQKAPNYEYCIERINAIYSKNHSFLIDLNMALLKFAANNLGITTPTAFASEYNIKSTSTQRLVDLVNAVEGDEYLSGLGARNYLDEELFQKKNIKVIWQDFNHPTYNQLFGKFVPNLSSLDYLMMQQTDI